MSEHPHLKKAPISEAILEFGIVPPADTSVDDLEPLRSSWTRDYDLEPLQMAEGRFTFQFKTGEVSQDVEQQHIGYRGKHKKHPNRILTLTTSSLAYHMLPQYTNWRDFFGTAWKLWVDFRDTLKPEAMRRLAARYISRLELPATDDLSQYVRRAPGTPDEFAVAGYNVRFKIKHEKTSLWATSVNSVEIPRNNAVVVSIDNDVYHSDETDSLDVSNDKFIIETFEKIHRLKNDLFFDTLTEEALEPYK